MLPITAVVIAKNEEKNIERTIAGFPEAIVLDNGSTDRTVELAEKAGAKVVDTSRMFKYSATEAHVKKFKKILGFEPLFKAGDVWQDGAARRTFGMEMATNDWVYFPDCDEHLTKFDEEEIQILWDAGADSIAYRFIHSHDSDGNPLTETCNSKLVNRHKYMWYGLLHEILLPIDNTYQLYAKKMQVDHWQEREKDEVHRREKRVAQLEHAMVIDKTQRMMFYLAREYRHMGWGEKAEPAFRKVLDWEQRAQERSEVHRMLAEVTPDKDEKRIHYHAALATDPNRREAWVSLGDFYFYDLVQPELARGFYKGALEIPRDNFSFLMNGSLYNGGVETRIEILDDFVKKVEEKRKES